MGLVGAKDQRLFVLIDLRQENIHPLPLPLADFDVPVKICFFVTLPCVDLPFHHHIVRSENILVECGLNLLNTEGREEAIVDAFLERIDINRLTEVGIGVHIIFTLRRGGEAQLNRWGEIFEDAAPVAFVARAASMALVDHNKIKEIRRVFAKVGRRLAILGRAAHEGLKDRKEQASVLRHFPFFSDV